ncbi:MAG TPA: nitroreductase family deazaflavin-dependent oxidoreductase [Microlunatus sp.]|nr:nitroreductase family deazaflavin-dependent oxidoreductase [Microlunatus sp.]
MTMPRALKGAGRVVNPVLLPLARRLPPLAVVHHVGRRSGRPYRTPVQAFPTGSGFLVGLVYDSAADWARNLEAAGGGDLTRAGRTVAVTAPRRVPAAAALGDLPGWARAMMRAVGMADFLAVERVPAEVG